MSGVSGQMGQQAGGQAGGGGGVSEQAGRCRAGGSRRIMAASPSHLNDRQAGMRACVRSSGRT